MAFVLCFAPTTTVFAVESPDGSLVQHMSFDANDQTVYTLRKFNGRYTALQVSQTTLDAVGLAAIRKAIDRLDDIYAAYRSFIGADPIGEGLMKVSMYENSGCDRACAQNIGWGSLEVRTSFFNTALYEEAMVHEIGHAFDLHGPSIFVPSQSLPPGHDWTFFWQHFMMYYLGMTRLGMNPTDFLDYQVKWLMEPYENLAGASWEKCVRDDLCVTNNPDYTVSEVAEGGAVLRIAQLFGKAAMLKWIPSLNAIIAERGGAVPTAPLDQSELLIESLSRATGTNLACIFEGWNWPVGTALRGRLSVYAANGFCLDKDGDGLSVFRHDCNDAAVNVRPGATETFNGIDDDCNGLVDETKIVESTPFPEDEASALLVPVPVSITGNPPSFSGDVQDWFRFTLGTAQPIKFTFKSKATFQGWIAIRRVGSPVPVAEPFSWGGTLWSERFDLPAGEYIISVVEDQGVSPNPHGGEYTLSIQKSYPYPMASPSTPLTFTPKAAVADLNNKFNFPLPAVPASVAGLPTLRAHYWVSGFGEVGSIAATSPTPFIWTAPPGTHPLAPTHRVKYHSAGVQVHAWSQPQSLLGSVGWTSQDIGAPSIAGSFTAFGEQELSIKASGADIWGAADSYRFTWLPLAGNGEITARVVSQVLSHSAVKGGVMLRESPASNSRNVFAGVQGLTQATLQIRATTGGTTSAVKRAAAPPVWVKLVRSGNVFTASTSPDAVTWTVLGSPTTVSMASSIYAGLALTSHTNSVPTQGAFSGVAVTATNLSLTGKVTTSAGVAVAGVTVALSGSKTATATTDASGNYSFTGLRQRDSYTVTPTQSGKTFTPSNRVFAVLKASATGAFTANPLPAPWASQDIGAVGVVGSAGNVSGTYTVAGSGADIWGAADAFRYVYFPATGDARLTLRVSALQNTHAWAKAGIMIRESLAAGSKNAFMAVSPSSGVTFQRRTATNGTTASTVAVGTVPRWLRLTRVGTLFTGYASSDGVSWTQIGSQSITMTAGVLVGIAVTSHNNGVTSTSTISNVTTN